jgi:hypothetical protein
MHVTPFFVIYRPRGEIRLDVTECGAITEEAFNALGKDLYPRCAIAELKMSGCSQTRPRMLHVLAERGVLSGLRVLEANDAWAPPARCKPAAYVAECSSALICMIRAASRSLTVLHLNGCSLPDDVLGALGEAVPNLASLAMVGNAQLTDRGLVSLAAGCSRLTRLEVGGLGAWSEGAGLAQVSGLRHLTISRRGSTCTDERLAQVCWGAPVPRRHACRARHECMRGQHACMRAGEAQK